MKDKLLPIAAVLLFLAVIFSVGTMLQEEPVKASRIHQTVKEMTMIADAAMEYRSATEGWPVNIDDLVPKYLRTAALSNPLGYRYLLKNEDGNLVITTLLPTGVARQRDLEPGFELIDEGTMDEIRLAIKRNGL